MIRASLRSCHPLPSPTMPIRKIIRSHGLDEIGIVYRSRRSSSARPTISCTKSALRVLRPFFRDHMETYEAARLLLIDGAGRLKACVTLSTGGLDATVFDPRIIFGVASRTLTAAIILAHNHPSGPVLPSAEDLARTRDLVTLGAIMQVRVLDHIILAREGHFSFADAGLL